MTRVRRLGILGGTFNPIHLGHLLVAEDIASELSLDEVLFVPNRVPPHKVTQDTGRVEDRVAMVQLATADNPLFNLCTIELERPGPSYTLDTMRELRDRLGPATELYFLVGCDALPDLHTWHEPQRLLQEFHIVVMERPTGGYPVDWPAVEQRFPQIREQVEIVDVPQIEISSVDIRRRVREGRAIRYHMVPAVERYIREHDLYRG